MQGIHMLRYPVIFASMVTKGCVESGKSVQQGGAKYSVPLDSLCHWSCKSWLTPLQRVEKCVLRR
ncbi:hypothetical protein [Eubacterium ramulus]|uniref:hypothetical protein n=1 Tax=Eubacterium ramulus TaxID=39490 RepID=UPI00352202BA